MGDGGQHLVRAKEYLAKLKTNAFSGTETPPALVTLIQRELSNAGLNATALLPPPPAGVPPKRREESEAELYRLAMVAEIKKAASLATPWVRRAELSGFGSEAMLATYISERLESGYRFAQKVDKTVTPPGSLLRRRGDLTMEELAPLCDTAKQKLLLLKVRL